jgi:hypothetical protein
MPFYYDVVRATATNGTTLTESTHLFAVTAANQETVGISGIFVSARGSSAGGGTIRAKTNSGTVASGGAGQTPAAKNLRAPAAQSTWKNDASSITPGGTLATRIVIGFAQTGGPGGWVAAENSEKIQMMANGASPVDFEVTSLAVATSVPIDLTVNFSESV